MNTGARCLKRGDTFDPEDFRMTHRLGVARGILSSIGIEPSFEQHRPECILHPDNRSRRCFGYSYSCDNGCRAGVYPANQANWPEWVSDAVFEHAFALADETQTKRGEHHRREAYAAKAARETADREARVPA